MLYHPCRDMVDSEGEAVAEESEWEELYYNSTLYFLTLSHVNYYLL